MAYQVGSILVLQMEKCLSFNPHPVSQVRKFESRKGRVLLKATQCGS